MYGKIIESVNIEGNFAILLAEDNYDVVSRREDGGESESSGIYTYIVCALCPLKNIEGGLGFKEGDTVRIVDGPFANSTATVELIDTEKKKVHLSVFIFGREIPTEATLDQVEPVRED
jgi:transcription antitermination factor NusG